MARRKARGAQGAAAVAMAAAATLAIAPVAGAQDAAGPQGAFDAYRGDRSTGWLGQTRSEVMSLNAMVATSQPLAAEAGIEVLHAGGNAFDAAVATSFVLQVVEPHLNGPGGDVPIILHDARAGTQHVVCGQGVAPDAATPAAFAALGLDLVPGTGLLPAVVPGAWDAWMRVLRDWGTWEVQDVLEYAIGYAARGIHIVPRVAAGIAGMAPMFQQEWKTSAAVWLPNGEAPAAGRGTAGQSW